jgi:hypothetical protein
MPAPTCCFPECTVPGMYGFREPGIANLPHRNPDAAQVWTCALHREHGEQLLQLKIEEAARTRVGALAMAARRNEGKLL